MLRTSSNMCDRSLSKHPCDTELGVIVGDADRVAAAQQVMIRKYIPSLNNSAPAVPNAPNTVDMAHFFKLARAGEGFIRSITGDYGVDVGSDNAAAGLLTGMTYKKLSTVMGTLHKHHLFGSKKRIHWKVKHI